MKVNKGLVEICKRVVAGLDGNLNIVPGIEDELGKKEDDAKAFLKDIVTREGACDTIQNNHYYGSKKTDDSYEFYSWKYNSEEKRQKIKLTEDQVRQIAAGELIEVEFEAVHYTL